MYAAEETVDLAGVTLHLRAQTPQLSTCLDWHFGALPRSDAPPDLRIDLVAAAPSLPKRKPEHVDGPVSLWSSQASLWLRHDAGGAARLVDDHLIIGGNPAPDVLWRMVRQVLFSALSWYLDRKGLMVLHGGLVSCDAGAVMLLGHTGSGKSTIAVSLHRSDWRLHGDDMVILDGSGHSVRALGVPKQMAVDASLWHFDRLSDPADLLPGDERGRVMVDTSVFSLGWQPLAAVIVAGHDEGHGQITALTHDQALSAVRASFLEGHSREALRRNLRHLAAVAGLPAWHLRLAADPARRSPTVVRQVASVVNPSGV